MEAHPAASGTRRMEARPETGGTRVEAGAAAEGTRVDTGSEAGREEEVAHETINVDRLPTPRSWPDGDGSLRGGVGSIL